MTHDIQLFYARPINIGTLDEQLRATLGSAYVGISRDDKTVRVHLISAPTTEQTLSAKAIVGAHNATEQSTEEQVKQTRAAKLAQLRARDEPLDLTLYDGLSSDIKRLALKIALLEAELKAR